MNGIGPGYIRTALTEDLLSNPVEAERLFLTDTNGAFRSARRSRRSCNLLALERLRDMFLANYVYVDGGWTAA